MDPHTEAALCLGFEVDETRLLSDEDRRVYRTLLEDPQPSLSAYQLRLLLADRMLGAKRKLVAEVMKAMCNPIPALFNSYGLTGGPQC